MKKECLSLLLAALAIHLPAATNPPSDAEKKALDLLRETIYQYERRRGATLPPPTLSTNALRRGTNGAVANVPSRSIPWSGVPAVTNVQPQPAPSRKPTPAVTTPTESPSTARETTLAELERLYLDGKITAKQFQKYLQQHEQQQQAAAATTPQPPSATAAVRPTPPPSQPSPARTTQPPPAKATPPPAKRAAPPVAAPSPDQAAISEVEKKMDELIKAKEEREQQAAKAANTATNAVATGPKTQRQKLDDLLRMYIEGKVTEAEYKDRREKILAEPSTK